MFVWANVSRWRHYGTKLIAFGLGLWLSLWAIPGLTQESPGNRPTSLTPNAAQQLVQQGRAAFEAGQYAQATAVLTQAAIAFEAQANPQAWAATLTNLGRVQFAAGDTQAALVSWQQAADLYREPLNDAAGVSQSQLYQAQAQQELGLYPQACQTLTQTLAVNGQLCRQRGNVADALAMMGSAAELNSVQLEGWRSLGDVLRVMGRLEDAQQILTTLTQTLPSSAPKDAAVLALGNTYRALGDRTRDRALPQKFDFMPWRCEVFQDLPRTATAYYQQAEQAYASLDNAVATTRTQAQLNRLRLLSETGDVAAAQRLLPSIDFNQLPLSRTRIYARIQAARGQTCIPSSEPSSEISPAQLNAAINWDAIAQQVNRAVQEANALDDSRAKSYALGNLAGLYEYRGWLAQAQDRAAAQQWQQQAITLTEQALYQAQPGEFADIAYRWQWQKGRLLKAQGQNTAAIAAYETSIDTLESVRGDLLAINSDVQFSFRDNVEPVYRELVDLLLANRDSAPTQADLQKILGESLYYVESLQLAELENFLQCNVETLGSVSRDRLSDQLDPPAALLDRIDQIFQNDPTTALIYPILLRDRIAIIMKRPGQPFRYHATPVDHETVEATLSQLQTYLTDPSRTADIRELSGQVYQWLIAPFEADLDRATEWDNSAVKNLVFVLDGSLRNIPMSVLYDSQRQQYLLERYAIALSSGLQLLDATRQSAPIQALLGGLSEPRQFKEQTFAALTNVPDELAAIQAAVPSQDLLNTEFNRDNLRSQLNSTAYSIVHMATHGKFSSDPEDTFLLLSDQPLQASELNDLLRIDAPDRANLIELLVLSACETATGDKRATLGLAGLALRAGARSTLATLWQVNDASTAALMSQFYANLNAQPNMAKAEALRQAQLHLRQADNLQDWEVPFFWAPYVLVGNWL